MQTNKFNFFHVAEPGVRTELPSGAEAWDPAAVGIRLRASGVFIPPIYTWRGGGQKHAKVIGEQGVQAFLVDLDGLPDAEGSVVEVLAYGFRNLAYRETARFHHRWNRPWKLGETQKETALTER